MDPEQLAPETVETQEAEIEGGTNPSPVLDPPVEHADGPIQNLDTAVEEPQFSMPGEQRREQKPESEADWYKYQYAQLANQLAEAQSRLEEFQMSGLDDSEREMQKFNRDRERWQQEVNAWRHQQAVQQWGEYWGQFTDNPGEIRTMQDPIQMGHTVATQLYTELQKARAEVAALKKAAAKPKAGPPVTTGSQGTSSTRSLFALTREEREALMHRARMGNLRDGDLPPLK